ncbi:MAG TPA: site-2 protease family protein [Chloroflexia bacterium]|nr:site-2 protease family protein [Chloroflexia bacterium]
MEIAYKPRTPITTRPVWRRVFSALATPLGVTATVFMLPLALGGLVAFIRWVSPPSVEYPVPAILGVFRGIAQLAATLLLVFLVDSAVHEGGHLLVSRLMGFRIMRYIVGPLMVKAEGGRVKVRANDSWEQYAGSILAVPKSKRNLRWRDLIVLAAGPVASLALSVLAGWLLIKLAWQIESAVLMYLRLQMIYSLFSALSNGAPIRTLGKMPDGARIRMLLAGGPGAERWCALKALAGESKSGKRPSEWDAECIRQAVALPDGSFDDQGGNHLAFYWALDQGDIEGAGMYLDRLLAISDGKFVAMQPVISADAAFYHAYYRNDPATARIYLEQIGDMISRRFRYMQMRAEAAVLLSEGKADEARARAREGLASMEAEYAYDPGSAQQEREWFRQLMA